MWFENPNMHLEDQTHSLGKNNMSNIDTGALKTSVYNLPQLEKC